MDTDDNYQYHRPFDKDGYFVMLTRTPAINPFFPLSVLDYAHRGSLFALLRAEVGVWRVPSWMCCGAALEREKLSNKDREGVECR